MSAIAGIFEADGLSDPTALQRMLRPMAHRSPDGSTRWQCRQACLAHGLLHTLPETDLDAHLVIEGDFAITADARLDNRDELIAILRPSNRFISDEALILAAYRRWGEGSPEHLLGDFAFAVWDGQSNKLFCARDHFGIKPFYYYSTSRRFIFGSEMKALFALEDVPQRVDEARIADYLVALVADAQSTLYSQILRLPPAHSLTVTAAGCRMRAYWRLEPSSPQSGSDLADRFLELFTKAVACRLRSIGEVGAMLSGGLDSSSIACVARNISMKENARPLRTISLVFDQTPTWNERPAIETVLREGGFDPTFVAGDNNASPGDFSQILHEQEGLFFAPGLAISRRSYAAAADRGIRVLLDGQGGDEVVSHGYARLNELAVAGRWLALWQEVQGVARTFGAVPWRLYADLLKQHGSVRYLVRIRGGFRRAIRRMHNQEVEKRRPTWSRFVNADFAERTQLEGRFHQQMRMKSKAFASERGQHYWNVSSTLPPLAFEILDRSAALAGIEPRYPFWDKRLVEFCLALPGNEKLSGGWSRLILRRAMEGILPPAVQWRRDKFDFTPHVVRGMLGHRALLEDILNKDTYGISKYVNLTNIVAAYSRILDRAEKADGYDVHAVWRTLALALWLCHFHPSSLREAATS